LLGRVQLYGGHWVDDVKDGVYKPDLQTDQMIAFIEAQASEDKPFFAVNGYYPPHDPYTAPKQFYEPYRDQGVPFAGYYAACSALDHNVGRLVDALEAKGLSENTVIVYYSDHGDHFGYRGEDHEFTCYEDSIKVPMVIHWPGTIAAETSIEAFVGLQDLMPTVLDWGGADIPDHPHGMSMRPLLEGKSTDWRDAHYTENVIRGPFIEQRSIRTHEWKLILTRPVRGLRGYTAMNELYDLIGDPEEELNIYQTPRQDGHNRFRNVPSQTDVIEPLVRKLRQYAESIDDQLGVDMADFTLVEIGKRRETETIPTP